MSKDIQVEIYEAVYSIRSDLDPAYVEQLARAVDARLRALAGQSDALDTPHLAILAALNLADELQQLKEKLEAERGVLPREFVRRLEQCNRLLEGALGDHPAA